jgi:hypothetical protein
LLDKTRVGELSEKDSEDLGHLVMILAVSLWLFMVSIDEHYGVRESIYV